MLVHFIFPDGELIIKLELPQVPSRGHKISFEGISEKVFEDPADFHKYQDKEYEIRNWVVAEVIWCINYDGILRINLGLQEIDS